MALNSDALAQEVVDAVEADGAFNGLSEFEKEKQKGIMIKSWSTIARVIVDHIKTNAVVSIPSGASVVDGVVAEDMEGVIE